MRGFRIGRVFGIDLRVDWSWALIFVLITSNLVSVFSQWHSDWPSYEGFAVAGCASLIFFGCVLLHELAHSLVAMSYGVKVRNITLYLFGGVASLEHEPPSPGAEFFTTIVGPLTSIALGIGFTALAAGVTQLPATDVRGSLNAASALGPLATLLVWLGPVNIAIGLFNLVPGYPLDGGRVLRSILWKLTGDLSSATRWASTVGQAIGGLFIACGIAMALGAHVPFFGTGVTSGVWIGLIGWFLISSALRAAQRASPADPLSGAAAR